MSPADDGDQPETPPPAESDPAGEEGAEIIELAEARRGEQLEAFAEAELQSDGQQEDEPVEDEGRVPRDQLEGVVESLLFAADKPLAITDLLELTRETDSAVMAQAVESLRARREGSGVEVAEIAGGYSLRTRVAYAPWVSKLLAGRPVRLSRAMLEAVAIIAYRQPITRPELDEIRGVDCGPVLKTLLDRGLIRIIGKKEEVGRPILYGTTPEFLRVFSLKDLTQLPTLRQFHELSAEHQATLEAKHGPDPAAAAPSAQLPLPDPIGGGPAPAWAGPINPVAPIAPANLASRQDDPDAPPDAEEDAALLEELETASEAAADAARPLHPDSGEASGGS
jgi:segregation and condensation protein B